MDDVRITQTFRLANPSSNEHGMAYLSYTAENLGAEAKVELRLLMDTALGIQDYGVYSNADVPETAGATRNFTDVPETLAMDSTGENCTDNGNFTVQGTFRYISSDTLGHMRLMVYPGENITPYDQNDELQNNATYWDPYYLELTNLQDQGSQNVNFKFQATPGEEATYRKLTFQAYKMEGSSTVLQAKNLLCTETVWILCPGTNGNVPEIGFTSASPDLIYTTGTRSLYLTGTNFNMPSNKSKFTLLLSRTDGGKIDEKDSMEIPESNFIIDVENNTAQVVLTQELPIGEYQLTIDYSDTTKFGITAPALRFQVTDDPEYRNDGYGVVTVEKNGTDYSVVTYATEEAYEESKKSLGVTVLLEFRGSFSEKKESGATTYTAVPLGKADNVITLNNCLDIRDGQVTITDTGSVIEVDFDASLLISGVDRPLLSHRH